MFKLILLLASLAASALPAQSANTRGQSIPKLLWKSASDFTSISSLRVLADGRIVAVDAGTREVFLLTSNGQIVRSVGRNGAGPSEYQQPRAAVPMVGDSTLIVDPAQRRLLLFGPSITFVRTIPFPATRGSGPDSDTRVDASGRVYFSTALPRGPGAGVIHVVRWTIGARSLDTLATLRGQRLFHRPAPTMQSGEPFVALIIPYSPSDGWTAIGNTVAAVRATPYKVEFFDGRSGAPRTHTLDYVPVRVTNKERAAQSDPDLRDSMPAFKPPMIAREVLTSESGEVWIRRTTDPTEPLGIWDVVKMDGQRRIARLPSDARVKWVGPKGIYVTRTDKDGLQRIECYSP